LQRQLLLLLHAGESPDAELDSAQDRAVMGHEPKQQQPKHLVRHGPGDSRRRVAKLLGRICCAWRAPDLQNFMLIHAITTRRGAFAGGAIR
jgi:hypothetical protein